MKIKVVILRSAGEKAFCAGASFVELSNINSSSQGENFFNGFAQVINSMRKCPKFILARIQGKCVGGGVGIAAAADYAIAVTGADIKLSELEIGIGPFVVGPAVERKIGPFRFFAVGHRCFVLAYGRLGENTRSLFRSAYKSPGSG
ncbi:MAG: enoyl-CoA hydratase-related protein [Puia sp.]